MTRAIRQRVKRRGKEASLWCVLGSIMIMVVADTGKRCLTVLGAGASLGGDDRLGVVACPFSPTLFGPLREQAPIS